MFGNMTGWKCKTAFVLGVLAAACKTASGFFPQAQMPLELSSQLLAMLAGSFGVVGIAHKIEKAGNGTS